MYVAVEQTSQFTTEISHILVLLVNRISASVCSSEFRNIEARGQRPMVKAQHILTVLQSTKVTVRHSYSHPSSTKNVYKKVHL